MNRNIISHIQSIEISHSFALNYNHGVELNGKWDFFEPTRFVYAFFALNMLYSIGWKLSLLILILNVLRFQKIWIL
jgi:hypothetical protein